MQSHKRLKKESVKIEPGPDAPTVKKEPDPVKQEPVATSYSSRPNPVSDVVLEVLDSDEEIQVLIAEAEKRDSAMAGGDGVDPFDDLDDEDM